VYLGNERSDGESRYDGGDPAAEPRGFLRNTGFTGAVGSWRKAGNPRGIVCEGVSVGKRKVVDVGRIGGICAIGSGIAEDSECVLWKGCRRRM